mmetsp:Transcript_16959/g.35187  ORF Transcript_16959/g.35187 Transcript_16959/m.35187 type:complete len:530 (-) Transcript_16959:1105-2694(-)
MADEDLDHDMDDFEEDVEENREYRLVMRSEVLLEKREYMVGRFPEKPGVPELGGVACVMFREGEETEVKRAQGRKDTEMFHKRKGTVIGSKRNELRERGVGEMVLPPRVRKKWQLRTGGRVGGLMDVDHHNGGIGGDARGALGGGHRGSGSGVVGAESHRGQGGGVGPIPETYVGTFEGIQKTSYAVLVLNDDGTAELIPLSQHSWYSFKPKAVTRNPAVEVTEEAERLMKKQEAVGDKVVRKLVQAYEAKLEVVPDMIGFDAASRMEKKEQRLAGKANSDFDADAPDFETTFDDDDVIAQVDVAKEEDEIDESTRAQGKRNKIDPDDDDPVRGREGDGASDDLTGPPSPGGPGSPGSESDGDDDEARLGTSGREILKLLRKQEDREHGNGSMHSSRENSPDPRGARSQSPSRGHRGSRPSHSEPVTEETREKRSSSNPSEHPSKRQRVVDLQIPSSCIPSPGEFVGDVHIRGVLQFIEDQGRMITLKELLHIFSQSVQTPGGKAAFQSVFRRLVKLRDVDKEKYVVLK